MFESQVDPVAVVLGTGRPGAPQTDDKTYLSEGDRVVGWLRPVSFLQITLAFLVNNVECQIYLHLIELSLLTFMDGSIWCSL